MMGSPASELERRLGEDQVEVSLSKGFWTAKYETTQGQWKRAVGDLPGEFTSDLPERDYLPVGNVNFAYAGAALGPTMAGQIGQHSDNDSSQIAATTTLAFASWLLNRSRQFSQSQCPPLRKFDRNTVD